jgi:hypothetical protein
MQLIVLYKEDGRIVALSRVAQTDRDESGVPTPRSGAEPEEGQRVALVEVDPAWHERPIADILQRCAVVHEGDRVRLQERGEQADPAPHTGVG